MTKNTDEPGPAAGPPRQHPSNLSEAIRRISASLDVATVLQEVVESARALTGARYGLITTVDESGRPHEFFTSGWTPQEHARLVAWPDALRLFEHFRDLEAPLRVRKLPDYVQALGFSSDLMPSETFQARPMRLLGEPVGIFFLAGKQGGKGFTGEDEEVLVLFAAQAAMAIANARTHREEQRARADLEALVETSPVGVVVFDAQSGAPVRFNQEARRIVEALSAPGHPPAELIEVLTCRLSDGREASLDELKNAETLRAAEIELSVPDGRSVRVLVNVERHGSLGRSGMDRPFPPPGGRQVASRDVRQASDGVRFAGFSIIGCGGL